MWTKFLYDTGEISFEEPFKKLVNQGMITGSSRFVYRIEEYTRKQKLTESGASYVNRVSEMNFFVSSEFENNLLFSEKLNASQILSNIDEILKSEIDVTAPNFVSYIISKIHVDVNLVDGIELNIEKFRAWKPEYSNACFLLDNGLVATPEIRQPGKYNCGGEVEKMSKSKYNTVNPDVLVSKYGADTFRMYEMFLGPVEMSKPWDTKGIEGVYRFLRKLWRLFFDDMKGQVFTTEKATDAELKVLHKAIKKIDADTDNFNYNTAVSAFMVAVNELSELKCHKIEILQPLLVLLAPYAPHIAEELWQATGGANTILDAPYPVLNESFLTEATKDFPISINGKMRTNITMPSDINAEDAEKMTLENEAVQKWLDGKTPKKVIFVKGRMVNVVV